MKLEERCACGAKFGINSDNATSIERHTIWRGSHVCGMRVLKLNGQETAPPRSAPAGSYSAVAQEAINTIWGRAEAVGRSPLKSLCDPPEGYIQAHKAIHQAFADAEWRKATTFPETASTRATPPVA